MTVPRVLVLYPKDFGCLPKFRRKIAGVLSRQEEFELAYFEDPREFIQSLHYENCRAAIRVNSLEGITHAIVFDDGEEFSEEIKTIHDLGIPCREIKIKITRVINIRKDERYARLRSTPSYEYIGRGSDWGNPYSMFEGSEDGPSSREEVIRKYAYDFDRELLKRSRQDALRLAGKRLGCFCKPAACHGDVIAEYLNCYDDGL